MGAGPKLDGAGTVKLVTLEEAMLKMQSIHGIVERMAIEAKGGKSVMMIEQQLKRQVTPLVGQLKAQFQLIADLATAMILVCGRGGPANLKVRALREYVGQLKTQLEIAVVQTKEKHAVKEEV